MGGPTVALGFGPKFRVRERKFRDVPDMVRYSEFTDYLGVAMPRPASDKRERLAAAAAELVAARGLDGATIAAIADRAGVPHGSVYYHLPSKEQIARAAVESVAGERQRELERWSEAADAE